MAESLTDAVCVAVAMGGGLPTLVGDWPEPWPDSTIGLLRDSLEALNRQLTASNSLVTRAAEFRAHYATPPEPIAGHSEPSYHELGRHLAMTVLHRVMEAANPSPDFILSPDPLTSVDFDRVVGNLPAVREYLRNEAPRFDWGRLVTMIEDEAARAARASPGEPVAAVVYLGGGRVRFGDQTITLCVQETAVLEALVDNGALSKKDLETKSGYDSAVKVLRQILKKYPALRNAIVLPGKAHSGGYRTTIKRSE